jgi:ATP-dependent Clp protease ATP-binding subunit ClpC
MFERYTERARRVIRVARDEARRLGDAAVAPEHVLIGLVQEGRGFTSSLFSRVHLSLDEVRREVEMRAAFPKEIATRIDMPLHEDAERVLRAAARESDRLKHSYIGTEHLLLGLLQEGGSVAGSILIDHGLRLESVRREVVDLVGDH